MTSPVDLSIVSDRVPRVTLGGVELSLREEDEHGWTEQAGTKPAMRTFVLSRHRAEAIFARGGEQLSSGDARTRTRTSPPPVGPLEFIIESENRPTLRVAGLYVIATQPGDDDNTLGVLVADRRWLLQRELVDRVYNARRPSGERRLIGADLVPIEVATTVADFTYRRTSLKEDGTPWTARDVLDDVLLECLGPGGWVYDDEPPFSEPVETFSPPKRGDEAVAAALALLPGMDIYPGADGRIHVYNTLSGADLAAAPAAGRIVAGSGMYQLVDRRLARPAEVAVYTDREQELRVDVFERESVTIVRGREPAIAENVVKIPDSSLTLTDGRVVHQGTWITIEQALDAWAADTANPTNNPNGPLTFDMLLACYPAGFTYLQNLYAMDVPMASGNPIWGARIKALEEHFRRTFRLLPAWTDKIRSLRAYRVAVLDAENGTPAPSPAFFDYVVKPSTRGLAMRGQDNSKAGLIHEDWAELLADAKPGPADVDVIDPVNGIFRISPRTDLTGFGERILLGTLDGDAPIFTAGDVRSATHLWSQVGMSSEFRLSTVLTVVPDAPNNEGRLHREIVSPAEAQDALGIELGECGGPPWHTFASDTTARFAWLDGKKDALLEAVYTGAEPPAEALTNPEQVRDVAVAQAARVYALLADRVEGQWAVSLNPEVTVAGSIRSVTHSVKRLGLTYLLLTRLSAPPILSAPSTLALLPDATRRALRRLVQP